MQRREFLAASGASLVAASGLGSGGRTPTAATAILESGEITLQPAGRWRWTGAQVVVQLAETLAGVRVEITAPEVALRAITLSWPDTTAALVLNDHWERTYGDVGWHPPSAAQQLPWYYLARRANYTEAFGVRTGGASFACWTLADGMRRLTLDTCTGGVGVQLGARVLEAAEILSTRGRRGEPPFAVLRRFLRSLCAAPRVLAQPAFGINDWYFAYGRNSAALILQHTELMAPFAQGLSNRPYSVIDAGWFVGPRSVPDDCCFGSRMDTPNPRFKDMRALAANIRKLGFRPGLWTRPLCAADAAAPSLLLPRIVGRDDPARPILDPTIPENLARVAEYFRQYLRWGYELVKIDFTTFDIFGKWGFEMLRDGELTPRGWRMHDVSRTNAEIIRGLYAAMRMAAGDTPLIGCNTVSHLSAGAFEINRIGDDTSGKEWDRTRKMGVNTLAFRGAHHGRFYAADADCVGLTTQVPWQKNRQWMELVAKSGTPLFISAQPEAVGAAQKPVIRDCFELASRELPLGEPLDWMDNAWPQHWRFGDTSTRFDW